MTVGHYVDEERPSGRFFGDGSVVIGRLYLRTRILVSRCNLPRRIGDLLERLDYLVRVPVLPRQWPGGRCDRIERGVGRTGY
jgi:hypothetical protein